MMIAHSRIALVDALHIQSAELWLRLGEPVQALRELERLSRRARRHPWAEAVFVDAFSALREPGYLESLAGDAVAFSGTGLDKPCVAVPAPTPTRRRSRRRLPPSTQGYPAAPASPALPRRYPRATSSLP